VLGVYFARPEDLELIDTGTVDCFGHRVYRYTVDLERCCLICSEPDPRTGAFPATPFSFNEELRLRYWLDVQAVTGLTWIPIEPGYCQPQLTGHLPPEDGSHFWGWHTSPGPGPDNLCTALETACTGRIVDFSPYPPDCWQYGSWVKQPWLCPVTIEIPPVHMAFELMADELPALLPPWIVEPPAGVETCEGYKAAFQVEACGSPRHRHPRRDRRQLHDRPGVRVRRGSVHGRREQRRGVGDQRRGDADRLADCHRRHQL
jgi:hypothetical protein